jgi:hypothetical protein
VIRKWTEASPNPAWSAGGCTNTTLKGVRKQVAEITKGRPELMIVASAMLIAASKVPDIDVFAKEYGHDFYS